MDILNKVLLATKKGGMIIFSNNYRKFELDTPNIAASSIRDITKQTIPFDFEGKIIRKCYKIIK
ncbi:hypothetical protein MKQ70_34170 [Chitinophaga sedimenti]|uniref:hypothetical protein n=1 Tax=Chitinophaga sedimenti TaxID=2033606 RepID=UPI00200321E6|nr:hypothetical protein [Chitinophaga sedimenti]MCK7559721.1 hypothetical protein [Chitinophaga sedimenti]